MLVLPEPGWKRPDGSIRLGGNYLRDHALFKIHTWAPRRAVGYRIEGIVRYDYGQTAIRRAWFTVVVTYWSTVAESAYRLDARHKGRRAPWPFGRSGPRFPVLRGGFRRPEPKKHEHAALS